MRSPSFLRVASLLLAGALGCGLISTDVTKVTFDLPTKHYTFTAPTGLPTQAVPCGAGTPIPTCPSLGTLTSSCDGGVCAAHVPFTVHQSMNLKMEVPQLMSVNSQSLADITLESMSYVVTNTTQVAIPVIDLYLAPDGVTDPADPQAVKFGTVPSVPAGTNNASGEVIKEPGADDLFIMFGHNFGTPFNFIASTTVVVPTGTPSTGMVDVTINGKVAAKLSL